MSDSQHERLPEPKDGIEFQLSPDAVLGNSIAGRLRFIETIFFSPLVERQAQFDHKRWVEEQIREGIKRRIRNWIGIFAPEMLEEYHQARIRDERIGDVLKAED